MGGADKALLVLNGQRLIDRVAARLAPQVDFMVISANGDAGRFSSLAFPVIPDAPDRRLLGPLGGLVSLMRWLVQNAPETGAVLTVPVDTPFFPDDLADRLKRKNASCAYAASNGRDHPTVALWRLDLLPLLDARLAERQLRLREAVAAAGGRSVNWAFEGADPFLNLNRPEDFARTGP